MRDIKLTRRRFLQAVGLGVLSFALPAPKPTEARLGKFIPDIPLGRVLKYALPLYKEPDLLSPVLGHYDFDDVIRIPKVFYTETSGSKKRGWYKMAENNYVEAAWIQTVFDKPNRVADEIPQGGCLGEITVPKTPVYRADGQRILTRKFYYGSTFWILDKFKDDFGLSYYELLDDYSGNSWYVRANAVRIVTPKELSLLSPDVAPDAKRIELNMRDKMLRAYEYERLVFETLVTTGLKDGSTPVGRFMTNRKRPCRRMIHEPDNPYTYDLPGVPWVCYITMKGVAFHGTYWHNNWGERMSSGCINMKPTDARWLYRWTLPHVPFEKYYEVADYGTQVDIIWGY
ncbi:MAG TPA: L,D-transpeptidase [Anaerolineaceae bacterium]|nr:L,D-transpeptidase [Anaerolineaceae bacterium]